MRETKKKTSMKGMRHSAHTLWWPEPGYHEGNIKESLARKIARSYSSQKAKSGTLEGNSQYGSDNNPTLRRQ